MWLEQLDYGDYVVGHRNDQLSISQALNGKTIMCRHVSLFSFLFCLYSIARRGEPENEHCILVSDLLFFKNMFFLLFVSYIG